MEGKTPGVTLDTFRKFKPSPELVRLAEAVFVSMAHEQAVRPIVDGYQRAILAKHQFRIARKWVREGDPDEVILDPKLAYLLDDANAAVFFAECHEAREAAGLKVDNPENCPLCVAENLRIKAEQALLKEMATLPGLSNLGRFVTLELHKKALDLSLSLVAPFCSDAAEIMKRLVAK